MKKQCGVLAAVRTDIGKVRTENQDRILCSRAAEFFAVADGMGGVLYGTLTAELAVKTMLVVAKEVRKNYIEHQDANRAAEELRQGLEEVSNKIYEKGNCHGAIQYGATFTGVMLLGGKAIWIHMGDSRGYRIVRYDTKMRQVTVDHNFAQAAREHGDMSETEIKREHFSSMLTRYVGMQSPATADVTVTDTKPGETILLCSDGLHGLVKDSRMLKIIRNRKKPEKICTGLIQAANSAGGRDNISVVCLKVMI